MERCRQRVGDSSLRFDGRLPVVVGGESSAGCHEKRADWPVFRPTRALEYGFANSAAHGTAAVQGRPKAFELRARSRHTLVSARNSIFTIIQVLTMTREHSPLRVGIGGPVGSGKTALTLSLCRALRDRYEVAVVTNDIYTEEDAQFLVRHQALAPERILGVETGGCPHTAIREDASINLEAVSRLSQRFPDLDLVF